MKSSIRSLLVALVMFSLAGAAMAQSPDVSRDQSQVNKMMNKLGRGIVNVYLCWVEIPRSIAIEWERTDPVTGTVVGAIKGIGWGFARFATGVFEVYTFPFPVPGNYEPMIEPEWIITDTWGAGVPGLTDMTANDPLYAGASRFPNQYRF